MSVCRSKLVKIMKPTREYTTPTTSLCFIAHLVVVPVVVHLLLLCHLLLLLLLGSMGVAYFFLYACVIVRFLTFTMERDAVARPHFPLLSI